MSTPPEISQVVCSADAAAQADASYDPSKDPKRKPTRSKDPGWKFAFWPDLENKLLLQCTLCNKRVTSGVLRMKKHLAGGFPEVEKCPKATAEISKEMHDYMKSRSSVFKPINLVGGADDGEEQQAEASSRASNATSVKRNSVFTVEAPPKRQSKSIADEIRKTPEEVVAERHSTKGTQMKIKDYGTKTKEQKDIVDGHVADFLYENCLPLNIFYTRRSNLVINEELRAELEAEDFDSDMEDNDGPTQENDIDPEFQVNMDLD